MKKDGTFAPSTFGPIILKMNLKGQLKLYLDLHEMTAAQLAKKAKVPKQSLSGWMHGNNPRDVNQVKRVADVFGVTVDHLMFGEGREVESAKMKGLEALLGDEWVGGMFEIRIRRVKS